MDNPIDYTTEARRINELVSMEDRENAYASLASRLREERDAAMEEVKAVKAESLRIVKEGDPIPYSELRFFHSPFVLNDAGEWGYRVHAFDYLMSDEQKAEIVQPFDLVHWCDTEPEKATDPVRDLLAEVEWEPPMPGQRPFTRGYNLAMMQVNRALNGESK